MQGPKHNNCKRHDKLGYSSICYILGVGSDGYRIDEGNLQVIMEKLSNSITLRYILTSSDYDFCISHYILHYL